MEIKQSKDVCIDHLTSTTGEDLEIMANIQTPSQMGVVMQGFIGRALNSQYRVERTHRLLRATVSWKGRGRDDLPGIGDLENSDRRIRGSRLQNLCTPEWQDLHQVSVEGLAR